MPDARRPPFKGCDRRVDETPNMYTVTTQDDALHLTRSDGAGYQLRRVGTALVETAWVGKDGASTNPVTLAPEDFLRQRPDVLVSPDCATAVRQFAYGM